MQIYAMDAKGQWISASRATPGKDYRCPGCQGLLRQRRGEARRPHFYHLRRPLHCRLSNKSLEHLQTQRVIAQRWQGGGTCHLEYRFPQLGRIADLCCLRSKWVIEVQCSPISLAEVQAREADYMRAGFQLLWVLHEANFNGKMVSAAERHVRMRGAYYTNINAEAEGMIYDQAEWVTGRVRRARSRRCPVDLSQRFPLVKGLVRHPLFAQRASLCPGDASDLFIKGQLPIPSAWGLTEAGENQSRWQRVQRFYRLCLMWLLEGESL